MRAIAVVDRARAASRASDAVAPSSRVVAIVVVVVASSSSIGEAARAAPQPRHAIARRARRRAARATRGRGAARARVRRRARRVDSIRHSVARAMSTPRKRARDDDGDGDGDGDDDDGDDDAGATRRPLVVDARDATLPDAALWDEHAERGDADALFEHLIAPLDAATFATCVDARAVCVRRGGRAHYGTGWMTLEAAARATRDGETRYGVDVDVTSYVDGARRTHNTNGDAGREDDDEEDDGRGLVDADAVWTRRFGEERRSVRLLHPQTRCDATWKILATLERYFECACGCNVYVTPANSQGFAPHYDDIDAFVLQIEGAKRWRVYEPFEDETHPRTSSRNFTQEEIATQRVVFDDVLEAGDFLYLPRGWIHQAECSSSTHSVHATLSTNQSNAPADALEIALHNALASTIDGRAELRRSFVSTRNDERRRDAALEGLGEELRAFASELQGDFGAALVEHACASLEARFMMQRCPPPDSHLLRSKARCTGDVAAAALRSGARTRVASQIEGAPFSILRESAATTLFHPFQNRRDGAHVRVLGVDSADEDGLGLGRVVAPSDVDDERLDELLNAARSGDAFEIARNNSREDSFLELVCELVRFGALAALEEP